MPGMKEETADSAVTIISKLLALLIGAIIALACTKRFGFEPTATVILVMILNKIPNPRGP